MSDDNLYHEGNRKLQDLFDSRRIADRLEEVTLHDTFMPHDVDFIESADHFFLATADADGWPDVSYKGGLPGFVRIIDEKTLAFPHYDGNGMFKSLGNLLVNPRVGMLFVNWQHPNRMRVQGHASIDENDPLLSQWEGAQLLIRVTVDRIFPNCPRYIHKMELVERSVFAPRADYQPPVPGWKEMPVFREHLPKTGPAKYTPDDQ
jgi:predicted pyridoxine 5'-phosphate oxidase superfamily flavin-nucleotide-binding protein